MLVSREVGLRGPDLVSGADADRLVHPELSLQPGGTHEHEHQHEHQRRLYEQAEVVTHQHYVHVS